MTVKNLTTGKLYPCTQEEFDKNFKGKLNWLVIDKEDLKPDQVVNNTLKVDDFLNKTTEKKTNKQKK